MAMLAPPPNSPTTTSDTNKSTLMDLDVDTVTVYDQAIGQVRAPRAGELIISMRQYATRIYEVRAVFPLKGITTAWERELVTDKMYSDFGDWQSEFTIIQSVGGRAKSASGKQMPAKQLPFGRYQLHPAGQPVKTVRWPS
jgi:hypothetical protein